MSAPCTANPCCSTNLTTQIPGSPGADGSTGAAGKNSYSITQAQFTVPAINSSVTITVDDASWMQNGLNVFIDGAGYFEVNSLAGSPPTAVGITYLDYSVNSNAGAIIASGANVSAAGTQPDFSGITSLTDNSGGSATNTVAVGVGEYTVAMYLNLADLANHDLVTQYTPGFKFKILGMDFIVEKAATTGAKAATVTPYITGVAVTGGVVALTSGNCTPQGNIVAGSAVTATNSGSSVDTVSITASSVTAFVEGAGWLVLKLKNMDTADAVASLAAKINAMLAAT